jgi:hypothetical protein
MHTRFLHTLVSVFSLLHAEARGGAAVRRCAQTFSIAIFCSALALSKGLEIVVFSPARRASRKLLERMVE